MEKLFAAHQLQVFDVEELWTHGGSLRVFARRMDDHRGPVADAVEGLRQRERDAGVLSLPYYEGFAARVAHLKRQLLSFLIDARERGKSIVGYGAPGKGNTLLNYCGIRGDFLDYTVDRSPRKQGKFLPGTHIPIHHPDRILDTRPDYILILPWNLKDEIAKQLSFTSARAHKARRSDSRAGDDRAVMTPARNTPKCTTNE